MNENKNILVIGGEGLIGSRIIELLSDSYLFESLSRSNGCDIADARAVLDKIENSTGQTILHLAAKTNVDACEQDKMLDKRGEAWKVNVEGARNVAIACERSGKKLIYFSSDFVFGGRETPEEGFSEEDTPDPINWYGQTKYEAEKIIQQMKTPWLIVRIAYPYRAGFSKRDFVRTVLMLLSQRRSLSLITDHIMSPTFVSSQY